MPVSRAGLACIKAYTVILDLEFYSAVLGAKFDRNRRRPRVLAHVIERFLRNMEKANGLGLRQMARRRSLHLDIYAHQRVNSKSLREVSDRAGQILDFRDLSPKLENVAADVRNDLM